ncbi:hypothetical protein CEXT_601191 [Caerostris extrusa]|uniref:Uncharacterized protein n=1 Tax=Caerostris extrusa TaxID=172846 RepID=A0AAV4RH21_CAEEX|nr:hypothetical protein CEXT_601191 [Caerostris extrusa]
MSISIPKYGKTHTVEIPDHLQPKTIKARMAILQLFPTLGYCDLFCDWCLQSEIYAPFHTICNPANPLLPHHTLPFAVPFR